MKKIGHVKMSNFQIHLVGSIPLNSAELVFDIIGRYLGEKCMLIPDGETGERTNWIGWQRGVFANQSALVQGQKKERDYQLNRPFAFVEGRGSQDS